MDPADVLALCFGAGWLRPYVHKTADEMYKLYRDGMPAEVKAG